MPLIHAHFFSQSLKRDTAMYVILPSPHAPQRGLRAPSVHTADTKFQTLYLLHGMHGDERSWLSQTRIEKYATERNLAVVMPGADFSMYTDMKIGGGVGYNYGKFVGRELVEVTRFMFPLSERREDTFIAGLSMGGYGAVRIGLEYADTFSAIGTLSGVLDVVGAYEELHQPGLDVVWSNAFGTADELRGSTGDLFAMSAQRCSEGKLPFIFQCCGTEDFLYSQNMKFRDHLHKLGVTEYVYKESAGAHEWEYWDANICPCVDSFPTLKKAVVHAK